VQTLSLKTASGGLGPGQVLKWDGAPGPVPAGTWGRSA